MAFEKGNKANQEWTLENALPRFKDALKYATEDEECLCMQDAVFITGIPTTTFYYLIDNHDELKSIKQDINDQIIRRINKHALQNKFASSPAIWRMKQLGERDEQHINTNQTSKTEITVTSKEAQKELDNLIEKFEKE